MIREINEALILNELRSKHLCSRSDIARETGLSGATVSTITGKLIEYGLVEEREGGVTSGGRPPVLIAMRPSAGYVVGVMLTDTQVFGVLANLGGTVVARRARALRSTTVAGVVAAVKLLVLGLMESAGGGRVLGIGLGLAGVIHRDTGMVRYATDFDWRDEPLAQRLAAATGLIVVIDNDVNTLVASEQGWGEGRGIANFAVVSVGRGVGLGLVLDGRVFRGAVGGAGELGHSKVSSGGPVCPCGATGCLEAVAAVPAIEAAAAAVAGRAISVADAARAARAGDQDLRSIFVGVGTVLGRAVGNVVNVFNPTRIVLSGEGTRHSDLFLPAFELELSKTVFNGLQDGLTVHVDPWEDDAWARGAARLFLNELFQPNFRHDPSERPTLMRMTELSATTLARRPATEPSLVAARAPAPTTVSGVQRL